MKLLDSIELAINNVLREGLTDVHAFSRPFEINMLKDEQLKKKIIDEIKRCFKKNDIKSLEITPITHVLIPKKELFDFRKCALIQPLDELKYLSLVLQIASHIESMRINRSKNIIFSYRFKPGNGYLFDSKYHYTTFREYVSKKTKYKNINVMVSCDIGNFYDRLNLHRLESILLSNKNININIIKQINELLLFWSHRDSYGLPVGSNASRILAEASLVEVDNYLISKGIDFCRFVDDYRIFAKDSATAHHWLSLLVDKLNKEGLFLNTSKTKIQDVAEKIEIDDENSTEDVAEKIEIDEEELIKENDSNINIENNNVTDTFEKKFNIPKIIRGYSGLIPTKFRKQTDSEKSKLKLNNLDELCVTLNSSILIDPKSFVEIIKTAIAQEKSKYLITTVESLNKFPQFLPYTLDAISKYEQLFVDEDINILTIELKKWLDNDKYSEYISVYLVRFFSSGKFTNKKILFEYFRTLKRNSGHYIGRALLEELEKLVFRGEVLEIIDYYIRADIWEKRQIAKIVAKNINDGEKRPFFKNILSQSNDIFLSEINRIMSSKDKYNEPI